MVAANTSVAREYHAGLSAMLGINAALAAHKGFVAEEQVLEMPRGFFSAYGGDHLEDVTKDLGKAWDITTDMAIKLVPGGHPHHAAAEAAANAAIAGNVDPADVASIMLSSAKYRTLPGPKHPTDLIGVAHSPAYFIAAAVADRGYGWIHASPAKVADPVIGRLIDKVTVDPNPQPYPDRFPHHHGATVTITLKDGRQFSDHVDFPRGSAPRGIEWADVDAKYRRLVPLSRLAPEKIEASLEVVHEFETVKTMSELTSLLSFGHELQQVPVRSSRLSGDSNVLDAAELARLNRLIDAQGLPGPRESIRFGSAAGKHGPDHGFLNWGEPFCRFAGSRGDHAHSSLPARGLLPTGSPLRDSACRTARRSGSTYADYGASALNTFTRPR